MVEVCLDLLNRSRPSHFNTEYLKKRVLPSFLREEAYALSKGREYKDALNRLLESVIVDPYWPLQGEKEFARQYEDRYAQGVAQYESSLSQREMVQPFSTSADMLEYDPNLELFLRWLQMLGKDIAQLGEYIDTSFTKIADTHLNNPFVFVYWAEALKIPQQLRDKDEIERSRKSSENMYVLPLQVADAAIEKLEIAYGLAPELSIISARLFGLHMIGLLNFKKGSKEYKRRKSKLDFYAEKGRSFLLYKFPQGRRRPSE
jgi:tetratricopeptide (TPR) repeat protein